MNPTPFTLLNHREGKRVEKTRYYRRGCVFSLSLSLTIYIAIVRSEYTVLEWQVAQQRRCQLIDQDSALTNAKDPRELNT